MTLQVRASLALAATVIAVACTADAHQNEPGRPSILVQKAPETPATPAAQQEITTIDHVVPARDSVGPAPKVFRWTEAKGADSYSIGVWNEVDRLIWRQDHITGTTTERPTELELEAGTYFWTVAALSGDRQIADSGLAAFVVRTPEP